MIFDGSKEIRVYAAGEEGDNLSPPHMVIPRNELLGFMEAAPYVFSKKDIKRGKIHMPPHILQALIDQQELNKVEQSMADVAAPLERPTAAQEGRTPKQQTRSDSKLPKSQPATSVVSHVENFVPNPVSSATNRAPWPVGSFLSKKQAEEATIFPTTTHDTQVGLGLLETVFAESIQTVPRHRVTRAVGKAVLWGGFAAFVATGALAAAQEPHNEHTGSDLLKTVRFVGGTISNLYDMVSAQTEGIENFAPFDSK